MKNFLFAALVAAFALSFSSCDESAGFESNDLIGTWNMHHKYHWEEGELVDDYVLHKERMALTIKIDGSWAEENYSEDMVHTTLSGTWELSGNRLRLSTGEEDEVWTIRELGFGRLVMTQGSDPSGADYRRNTFTKAR